MSLLLFFVPGVFCRRVCFCLEPQLIWCPPRLLSYTGICLRLWGSKAGPMQRQQRSLQICGSSLFMADEIHLWPFLNLIGLGWPLRLYGVFSGVSHQCFLEQHWSTTGTIWWCLVCSFFNWHRRGLLHTADIYSCLAPVFSPDSNIPVFWKEWWNMWNSCFRFSLPWPHLSPPGPPCHKEENGQGCLSTGGVVCGGASRCCC